LGRAREDTPFLKPTPCRRVREGFALPETHLPGNERERSCRMNQ
jgi:hypothetical protein